MSKIFTICGLSLLFAMVLVAPARADGNIGKLFNAKGNLGGLSINSNVGNTDIKGNIGIIIEAALGLVATIFFILIVYAGIMWMTAAGIEERSGKARKIIIDCVVGLAITVSAYGITLYMASSLGGGTTTGTGAGGTCEAAGGACESQMGGNPCDSSGIDGIYQGNKISDVSGCNQDQVCCELKPGTYKCNRMGGVCVGNLGTCPIVRNKPTKKAFTCTFSEFCCISQ